VRDSLGNTAEHGQRHVEGRVLRPCCHDPRLEDLKTQFFAERPHFDDQPTRQPRAHAIVKAFQVRWRPIGGDDNLPTGIDQGIEGMTKFRLLIYPAGIAGRR
jgi:hypothetical protein